MRATKLVHVLAALGLAAGGLAGCADQLRPLITTTPQPQPQPQPAPEVENEATVEPAAPVDPFAEPTATAPDAQTLYDVEPQPLATPAGDTAAPPAPDELAATGE
jgi:hypothetical protein